jgi:hypothetical protein
MNQPPDFNARSEMYRSRMRALGQAAERSRDRRAYLNLASFVAVAGGLVLLWFRPTIRWAIGIGVVLVVLRWIGNMILYVTWTRPEMAHRSRVPAPAPRES